MSPSRQKRDRHRERHTRVRALLHPQFSEQLLGVWRHACWVLQELCHRFATPRALAEREWINRADYSEIEGWIKAVEMLTRRLLFVAALAINVVLKPLRDIARIPRARRYRIAWPAKPETWRASFRMFRRPRDGQDHGLDNTDDSACDPETEIGFKPRQRILPSFPLARRLEALRRALVGSGKRAHRLAIRLARLKLSNQTATRPRLFAMPQWSDAWCKSRGMLMVATGMEILTPLAREHFTRWNQNAHPG